MSARPLAILAIVAIVLSAVVFFGNRPAQQATATNTLFAPALAEQLDAVSTVRIVGAGNATLASLTRAESAWVVDERDGYPANTNAIRSALTLLSRASVIEAKTSNPAELDRLGLGDLANADARGVGIEFLPESLGLPGIILGDSTGSSYRYARLSDSNQSWLINADPEVPADTTQWLQSEILSIEGSRVERILIEHADGQTLDIFKSAPDQPNYSVAEIPEGRDLQYPGVANVIGNVLRNLQLEDVAAASADAGTPEIRTQFDTFDGLVITAEGYRDRRRRLARVLCRHRLAIQFTGRATAAEAQAINARVSGWRYRIPEYQYSQIGRRIEDLLSAEESED